MHMYYMSMSVYVERSTIRAFPQASHPSTKVYEPIIKHLLSCDGQAYDLESKPWHQVLHILLQTNLPNLFPMALIAIFLYLQVTHQCTAYVYVFR